MANSATSSSGGSGGVVGRALAGRYRVVEVLSTGANTLITDAVDLETDTPVTVKLLRPDLASSPEFRAEFRAAATRASELRHPNVATVLDWGEVDQPRPTVFWVVEHLAGGSLRDLLDRGRLLAPSQALVVGLEATRALDAAHKSGVIHTELTPSKLVFGTDRRLRIVDFEMARLLGEPAWQEPARVPTHVARYASPEQALGRPAEAKSDVYALSLSLLESVTGEVPFASDSTVATLSARVGKLLPVSADLGSLAAVLERAARPEPEDRSTAAEFGAGLVQAAGSLPRPEPVPILSTGLFDSSEIRRPTDPTGGFARPAGAAGAAAVAGAAATVDPAPGAVPDGDTSESPEDAASTDPEPAGAVPGADTSESPEDAASTDPEPAGDVPGADTSESPDNPETPDAADPEPAAAAAGLSAAPEIIDGPTSDGPGSNGPASDDPDSSGPGSNGQASDDPDSSGPGSNGQASDGGLGEDASVGTAVSGDPPPLAPPVAAVGSGAEGDADSMAGATATLLAAPPDPVAAPPDPGADEAASASDDEPIGIPTATLPVVDLAVSDPTPTEIYDDERPGRPWARIILITALVLAGVAALAYAGWLLTRTKSYEVPDLVGIEQAVAVAEIEGNDWVIVTERERDDDFPEPDTVIRTEPVAGVDLDEGEPFLMVVSDGPEFRTLPEFVDLTFAEAQARLTELGLIAVEADERQFSETVPDGSVISWRVEGADGLAAGGQILPGETVVLTVSKGPAPRQAPPLAGKTVEESQAAVEDLQLVLEQGPDLFSDDVPIGLVIVQSPDPGTLVERGGTVTIQVSKGPDVVPFPAIVDLPYTQAETLLLDTGFTIGSVLGTTEGTVISATINGSNASEGDVHRRGTPVDIISL